MSATLVPPQSPVQRPPFRAEHLGSLLRPDHLVKLRYAAAGGTGDAAQLEKAEDEAIRSIVEVQQRCGFHAIGDGEYRRHQFWGRFFEELHGMAELQTAAMEGYDETIFRSYAPDVSSFLEQKVVPNQVTVCVGKISHPGRSTNEKEVKFMQTLVPREQWRNLKLTLISPSWYWFRYAPGRAYPADVYATDEAYFADVSRAYATELRLLYDLGVRNVQIDDPNLAYFCSEPCLAGWAKDRRNPKNAQDTFDMLMDAYNACFERPADMHLGIHLCRGNYLGSRHFSEGAYDRIAKTLFNKLNVNTFYLEYDTPRAGGFEPLEHLPRHKNVVLGVVTSKFPKLEDPDAMIARINQAADIVAQGSGQTRQEALQRISISPQCGFASHSEGNALGHDDMVAKLRLVRSIADSVWPGQP